MKGNGAVCILCNSKEVIKKGIRKLKRESVQRYQCSVCGTNFTDKKLGNSSYSAKVILEAINNYNLGLTLDKSSREINKKFHVKTYPRLISSWLERYEKIIPYKRFRQESNIKQEIVEMLFNHQQPYLFSYSKQKVDKFLNNYFLGLKKYLFEVVENCQDDLFLGENSRASEMKFSFKFSKINVVKKKNFACGVAEFSVKATKTNYERHELVEKFLLVNDTATVACEVPIWLEKEEVPLELIGLIDIEGDLTGHIDVLQCRFGLVYVLDYKPNADKENREKVISQLFSYVLALSVRTGIWLRNFRCAWFDSDNYYEFNPGEIVLDYLRDKGIYDKMVLEKYNLNEGARKYFTSGRFHFFRKSSERNKKEGILERT
jgi:transposase-like protein